MRIDYMPCKECKNMEETYGMICIKCGKCGRKFEDGVLINGDEYPEYDPEMEENKMYGFIEGWSFTEDIHYCPYCGERYFTYHVDGTATCDKCGKRFGVIEIDDESEEQRRNGK